MARNRQRAKQRQAARRARQTDGKSDGARRTREAPVRDAAGDGPAREAAAEAPAVDRERAEEVPAIDPALRVGAPPQDAGRSDAVLEGEEALELHPLAEEEDDAELDERALEDEALAEEPVEKERARGPRGVRAEARAEAKDRPRFIQFLIAVWAELKRVQWPDRKALTTLTGVVLGFVLIAGGYLGLLDAIFSRIIQAIL